MDVVDAMCHWEVKGSGTMSCGGDGVKGDEKGDDAQDGAVGDSCFHWYRAHIQGTVVEDRLQPTVSLGGRG